MSAATDELIDTLTDLIGRMDRAEAALLDMATEHKPSSHEAIRLDAKANGVVLARSYVREALQRARGAGYCLRCGGHQPADHRCLRGDR